MLKFANEVDYLQALRKDPGLSIIGVGMAAKMLAIKRASVEQRIARETLPAIMVGKRTHVLCSSLLRIIDDEAAMTDKVTKALRSLIRHSQTMPYGELMSKVGLAHQFSADRKKIGAVLGKISEGTWETHKVLVSILIVDKGTGMPSDSFWGLYEDLTGKKVRNRLLTFEKHCNEVYEITL